MSACLSGSDWASCKVSAAMPALVSGVSSTALCPALTPNRALRTSRAPLPRPVWTRIEKYRGSASRVRSRAIAPSVARPMSQQRFPRAVVQRLETISRGSGVSSLSTCTKPRRTASSDAHTRDPLGDVEPPDLEAIRHQQTPRRPAAREREVHVPLEGPVHQVRIGLRHRAGFAGDAGPADPPHLGLTDEALPCTGIGSPGPSTLRRSRAHWLPLGIRPALPSAQSGTSGHRATWPLGVVWGCRLGPDPVTRFGLGDAGAVSWPARALQRWRGPAHGGRCSGSHVSAFRMERPSRVRR